MIYLSSNSGELFKQVLLLNPLDMFALANLLCPSLALPPFRARPPPTKFFHSVPSPDSCFSKERGTANGWMDARRNSAQTAWGMGELASWLRSKVSQQGKFPSSRCAFFFLIGNPLRNSGTNFGFSEASLCSEVNTVLVITNAEDISVLCHRTLSLIHQPYT